GHRAVKLPICKCLRGDALKISSKRKIVVSTKSESPNDIEIAISPVVTTYSIKGARQRSDEIAVTTGARTDACHVVMRTRLCVSGGKAQSITKSAIEVELESVVLGIATGREIADLPDLRKRRKQSRGISRGARGQAAVDIGQRLPQMCPAHSHVTGRNHTVPELSFERHIELLCMRNSEIRVHDLQLGRAGSASNPECRPKASRKHPAKLDVGHPGKRIRCPVGKD